MKVGKIQGKKVFFGWKELWNKTPKILLRIGYALLGVTTAASAMALVTNDPRLSKYTAIVGLVALFIVKLFGEENPKYQEEQTNEQSSNSES